MKINTGDQSKAAVTADQQRINAGDRTATQKIPKAVMPTRVTR
jgi:hypothetical protein